MIVLVISETGITVIQPLKTAALNPHERPSFFSYSFMQQVICHGIPDMRELQNGDIVNVDVSVYYNGFHGDLNETFFVGDVDRGAVRLVECAYRSLAAAIALVRPGTLYK